MNWKNTAENILILLLGILAGTILGFKVSITTAKAMLENQKELIQLAIQKETTAINNNVITEIKKIKGKKSQPINVIVRPNLDNTIRQNGTNTAITDTIPKEKKRFGWWLIGKKKN